MRKSAQRSKNFYSVPYDPLFSLEGSVVAVTGALGRLGRVYMSALAARGAKVAAIDVASVVESNPKPPPSVRVYPADVTVRSDLETVLDKIRNDFGRTPDGLINNAALDSPPDAPAMENGPFEYYPEESWDTVMRVNVKGVFLCCQIFGGAMAQAGRGSIVNIGSIYGKVSPDQNIYEFRRLRGETFFKPAAYSASKSALYNLTRYLAIYWAKSGVRVNTLTLAGVYEKQDEEFLKSYCAKMPIGRMAAASDYVGALVFLLSGASSYMTGADLAIDGGWTAY